MLGVWNHEAGPATRFTAIQLRQRYPGVPVVSYVNTSAEVKAEMFEHLPGAVVMDILGSSEGGMGQTMATKANVNTTAKFGAMPTTKVINLDTGLEVVPGSGEQGMVGVSGLLSMKGVAITIRIGNV